MTYKIYDISHIWVMELTKIDFSILDFQIFDDVIAALEYKKSKNCSVPI